MSRRGWGVWAALTLGLLLLFNVWPALDLLTSGLFYTPAEHFFLAKNPLVMAIYRGIFPLGWAMILGLLIWLGTALIQTFTRRHATPPAVAAWRKPAYLLLALLLGPLLITHTLFKDHWGRARPVHITPFGGSKQFTPAAQPSTQCARNCSFVSGHAAMAFSPLLFGFAWPHRRRLWWGIGLCTGLGMGTIRILQGGHFLSDVLFAGLIVWFAAALLQPLLTPSSPPKPIRPE